MLFAALVLAGAAAADAGPVSLSRHIADTHAAWAAAARVVALSLEGGSGPGPRVAPAWKADVSVVSGASSLGAAAGTFAYDAVGQRWRIGSRSNLTLFHASGDAMFMDQLARNLSGPSLNMTFGEGGGARCSVFPTPYYDMFAILAITEHKGTGSVGGDVCDLWAGAADYQGQHLSASACIGPDGVPRAFNMTTGMAYKAASESHYIFANVTVDSVGDADFAPSDACAHDYPMPPCPQSGHAQPSVVDLTLYRVHSAKEPLVLSERNLGDALGDMAFFCDLAGVDGESLVTKWAVKANSSWGQYGFCLFSGGQNVCYGHTGRHVGREGALGVGDGGALGQCGPNVEVGSWYSFPGDGACPSGAAVGAGGCTWAAAAVRTVSAGCVMADRGLRASCARERGHAPMSQSAAIFAAALETDDPALGGCPDAGPAATATIVV